MRQAWADDQKRQYALVMAGSLNSKHSRSENLLPFLPKHFYPPTEEEKQKIAEQEKKLQVAQQKFLATQLDILTKKLNNGKTVNKD